MLRGSGPPVGLALAERGSGTEEEYPGALS